TPSLAPVGGAAAAAELFARSFPPPWEPRAVRGVLALCARVTARVPSARFRFRPDASAVAAVVEAVRPGAEQTRARRRDGPHRPAGVRAFGSGGDGRAPGRRPRPRGGAGGHRPDLAGGRDAAVSPSLRPVALRGEPARRGQPRRLLPRGRGGPCV